MSERLVEITKVGNEYQVNTNATTPVAEIRGKVLHGESSSSAFIENITTRPDVILLNGENFLDEDWYDGQPYGVEYDELNKAACLYFTMGWGEYTLFKNGDKTYLLTPTDGQSLFDNIIEMTLDTSLEMPYILGPDNNPLPVGEISTLENDERFVLHYDGNATFAYLYMTGEANEDKEIEHGYYEDFGIWSGETDYITYIVLDVPNHTYNICKYQITCS